MRVSAQQLQPSCAGSLFDFIPRREKVASIKWSWKGGPEAVLRCTTSFVATEVPLFGLWKHKSDPQRLFYFVSLGVEDALDS